MLCFQVVKLKTQKPTAKPDEPSMVLTIGHSTRSIKEFIRLLQAHQVRLVVDIRTIPRSRHNPQFNTDSLATSLKTVRIGYRHMPTLGGLRRTTKESINMGWRNSSFRGFADYMQTSKFERALASLIKLTNKRRLALMCAEAVPWRCHRSLIADALKVHRIAVEDIMSLSSRRAHTLTSFARVRNGKITYPAINTENSRK